MLKMIDVWLGEIEPRALTVLNLNRVQLKRPKINWKWLLVLIYFLIVLHSWKYRKSNTAAWRILFSPLLLAFRN